MDQEKKPQLNRIERYIESFSRQTHYIIAFASLLIYVSMIIFAFVPLTHRIGQTGSTTMELQNASTRSEVDKILTDFSTVMTEVRLLSLADYIFIIAGFFLFFSLQSLVYIEVKNHERLIKIPQIGMILTIISRSLDSLENLWVILIYSNPSDYPSYLIFLTNITEDTKWLVVGIEYTILGISVLIGLLARFTNVFDSS